MVLDFLRDPSTQVFSPRKKLIIRKKAKCVHVRDIVSLYSSTNMIA